MVYIITAVAVLFLAVGCVNAASPSILKGLIGFIKGGKKRVYIGGVIRIVIGGLLLWASSKASVVLVPIIIGAIVVISGILVFVLGAQKIHSFVEWWEKLPEYKRRFLPLITAVLGLLLLYSV